MIKQFLQLSLLTTIFHLSSALALHMNTIDQVFFFGDSLSDNGYLNASQNFVPKGQTPVYTTPGGHPWSYYIARLLNKSNTPNNLHPMQTTDTNWADGALTGNNYAAGGAVTRGDGIGFGNHYRPPPLDHQINEFLNAHQPSAHPNDVYFIWIGANDILKTYLDNKSQNPLKLSILLSASIGNATTNIANSVERLANAGAKHIVVLNLPPLGDIPLMNDSGEGQKVGNFGSDMFNASLKTKLLKLETKNIHVIQIDVNSMISTIIRKLEVNKTYQDPSTGITISNYTSEACLESRKNPMKLAIACRNWVNPSDWQHYLYADAVHPTDAAGRILSEYVLKVLSTED